MRRLLIVPVLLAAPLCMQSARAQNAGPPPRIDNHANGLDYQPNEGSVAARERNAGVEPSSRQLSNEDQQLNQINRQLLGNLATPRVGAPAH